MLKLRSSICIAAICFVSLLALSQNKRPRTVAEVLQQHNIALTKVSLVQALKNPDPEVRSLAAAQLAGDGYADSIPFILEALASEKVLTNQPEIAYALAQLGDRKGYQALKNLCDGSGNPGYIRLTAAQHLLNLHSDDCLNAVVGIIQNDSDSRAQALLILPRFQLTSKTESTMILDLMLNSLSDPAPSVRIAASVALGASGNVSAAPHLQKAIVAEKDETVRSRFQSDLQSLQEIKSH